MHVQTSAILGATPWLVLSRALSQDDAPLKMSYLLAHISNKGVVEDSRIFMP